MIMERAQVLTCLITLFPDIILITVPLTSSRVPAIWGFPFPLGVGQVVGTSSTPELARLPTSIPGI
jgi:hypothetical protein